MLSSRRVSSIGTKIESDSAEEVGEEEREP
jgi:hypothetical protein